MIEVLRINRNYSPLTRHKVSTLAYMLAGYATATAFTFTFVTPKRLNQKVLAVLHPPVD
jgi:hypothetical protein